MRITNPPAIPVEDWKPFETLSPTNVLTINSSALPTHNLWKLRLWLRYVTGASGQENVNLRMNNDSGNHYNYNIVTGINPSLAAGDNKIPLGSMYRWVTAGRYYPLIGEAIIAGQAIGTTNCLLPVAGHFANDPTGVRLLDGFLLVEPAADLSLITVYAAYAFTGKIHLLYYDFS